MIQDFTRGTALAFESVTAALAKLQREIAVAEERWLELEIMREELTGAIEPVRP